MMLLYSPVTSLSLSSLVRYYFRAFGFLGWLKLLCFWTGLLLSLRIRKAEFLSRHFPVIEPAVTFTSGLCSLAPIVTRRRELPPLRYNMGLYRAILFSINIISYSSLARFAGWKSAFERDRIGKPERRVCFPPSRKPPLRPLETLFP